MKTEDFKAGDRVQIKPGWHRAGTILEVLGPPVYKNQWWLPVDDPEEEDPTFYKVACLEKVN